MKSVLEQLMDLTSRKKVVDRAEKNIKIGEAWVYRSYLWRGDTYMIEARGSRNVKTISCSIMNLYNGSFLGSESGKHVSFTLVPEHDGIYKISVTNESTHSDTESGKVTISITKALLPPR